MLSDKDQKLVKQFARWVIKHDGELDLEDSTNLVYQPDEIVKSFTQERDEIIKELAEEDKRNVLRG